MVDVHKNQFDVVLKKEGSDPLNVEHGGLGRQRLMAAEAKARNLVHCFRVDYSGRYECISDDIKTIGVIIRKKATIQNLN